MDGTINENVKIVRNAKISTKVNATGAYQLYNFSSIRTTANNNPGSSTSGDNGNGNATLIQKATILAKEKQPTKQYVNRNISIDKKQDVVQRRPGVPQLSPATLRNILPVATTVTTTGAGNSSNISKQTVQIQSGPQSTSTDISLNRNIPKPPPLTYRSFSGGSSSGGGGGGGVITAPITVIDQKVIVDAKAPQPIKFLMQKVQQPKILTANATIAQIPSITNPHPIPAIPKVIEITTNNQSSRTQLPISQNILSKMKAIPIIHGCKPNPSTTNTTKPTQPVIRTVVTKPVVSSPNTLAASKVKYNVLHSVLPKTNASRTFNKTVTTSTSVAGNDAYTVTSIKTATTSPNVQKSITTSSNGNSQVLPKISKDYKNQCKQLYNQASSVGQVSKEVLEGYEKFHQWQLQNDPQNKMSNSDLNAKLTKFMEEVRSKAKKTTAENRVLIKPPLLNSLEQITILPATKRTYRAKRPLEEFDSSESSSENASKSSKSSRTYSSEESNSAWPTVEISDTEAEPEKKLKRVEKAIETAMPKNVLKRKSNTPTDADAAESKVTVGSSKAEMTKNSTPTTSDTIVLASTDSLQVKKNISAQITNGQLTNQNQVVTEYVDLTSPTSKPSTDNKTLTLPASEQTTQSTSSGHSSIQILNGKLSDPKGPIKVLNKTENIELMPVTTTNTAAAAATSTSTIEDIMDLEFLNSGSSVNTVTIHENLLNIYQKQNKKQHNKQIDDVRCKKIDDEQAGPRRTRSLSLSGGQIIPTKSRFNKNAEWARRLRAMPDLENVAKNLMATDSPIEFNESIMKSALLPERAILGKSKHKTLAHRAGLLDNFQSRSAGNSLPSTPNHPSTSMQNILENGKQSMTQRDFEKQLSWNEKNNFGKLRESSITFVRNEFGLPEFNSADEVFIHSDGRQSPKLYGKQKQRHQEDDQRYGNRNIICGHKSFGECFNDIIGRIEDPEFVVINDRKPYEYFSNEYKDLIKLAIERENGRCDLITPLKISEAMIISDGFKLPKATKEFDWFHLLEQYNEKGAAEQSDFKQVVAAPATLFNNPFPCTINRFVVGHKLEAIDPQNCSLFCVCSVADKKGFRIKLHFDGYHSTFDFWVNADSKDIFPAGWCNKTARDLQSPYRRLANNRSTRFDWKEYVMTTKSLLAPRSCFPHLNTSATNKNPFKIGMKLEADDIKFTRKICVATIGDVIDNRILITFDSLDEASNYWTDITSPYIHPVDWHLQNGYSITPPSDVKSFNWAQYLRSNRAEAAPEHAFCTRKPTPFSVGMAIEIVDKKNPSVIRPASIVMIDDYEIKVLFIGWPEKYAYWVDDDSPDIHPVNWAQKTGHPIELPSDDGKLNGCGIPCCSGIGNFRRPEIGTHTTLEECPYEISNWTSIEQSLKRPNRIERKNRPIVVQNSTSGGRTRINYNPALSSTQVSLQPFLNPAELGTMSTKDVEIFRRLQVSAKFLLGNFSNLTKLRENWINKLPSLRSVQISAAAKNPLNWSVQEVAQFVSQLPNCSTVGQAFAEHDIDGVAFLALQQNDMIKVMGLSLGTAIKVFNRILILREECNAHYIDYA